MNNRVLIVVGTFLTILLAYVAYTSLEYYEEDKDTGWSKQARRNRFYAAELYAKSIDVAANSYDSYLKVPGLDDIDTLFIAESGQVISEKRLAELMEWVSDGGHLIVAAHPPSNWHNDRILEYFDLSAVHSDYDFYDEDDLEQAEIETNESDGTAMPSDEQDKIREKKKKEKLSDQLKKYNEELTSGELDDAETPESSLKKAQLFEQSIEADEITKLRFKNINYELRAQFDVSAGLSHPSFGENADTNQNSNYRLLYWAGDDWATHLVQLELGYGLVSVLSDPGVFDSSHISYFDHALLWQILIEGGDTLVLLYGSDMPSLWYMLKTFMPEVLVAFTCFVFAWLWYRMQRFGSVRRVDYHIRRSILEHIAAASGYYWRGGWQSKLLKPVQFDINHRAEKVLPAYSSASDDVRWELLAAVTHMETDTIKAAMQASAGLNEESFTQIIKTLQRIKDSL